MCAHALLGDGAPEDTEARAAFLCGRALRVPEVMRAVCAAFYGGWGHERLSREPYAFPSDHVQPGVVMCKYRRWFAEGRGLLMSCTLHAG